MSYTTQDVEHQHLESPDRCINERSHTSCDSVDLPDYDELLQASKEYNALKDALLAAGVTQDHLDTLVKSQLPKQDYVKVKYNRKTSVGSTDASQDSPAKPWWSAEAAVFVPKQHSSSPKRNFAEIKPVCSILPTPPSFRSDERVESPVIKDEWYQEQEEPEYYCDDHQDRSVTLQGFGPYATVADVCSIVRGGMVLNIFIRPRERSAHVAFVDPVAAEKFVMHYKRNDLYFKGKRIDVMWDERQYTMPGHIRRQVYKRGATRNIVLRFATKDMTPESILEDLDHIHRLEVVDITTKESHVFISTNSIQHAITARQCMQSRLKYKGTRIEFFEDECDQVLPVVAPKAYRNGFEPKKQPATVAIANRFAVLFESDNELLDKDKSMKRIALTGEVQVPA